MEGHKNDSLKKGISEAEVPEDGGSFDSFLEGMEEEVAHRDDQSESDTFDADTEQAVDIDKLVRQIDHEYEEIKAKDEESRREKEERRRERIANAREKIRPLEEQIKSLREIDMVSRGEQHYKALIEEEDAFIQNHSSLLDSKILQTEIQIEIEEMFNEEAGESTSLFGESLEQVLAPLKDTLERLKKEKESGLSIEEKEHLLAYQRYFRGNIMSGYGPRTVSRQPHESDFQGWYATSPKDYIIRMGELREYRNSPKFKGKEDSVEQEKVRRKNLDNSFGYHLDAQGMAIGALKAGDIEVAVRALKFAEGISSLKGQVGEKIKELILNLDPEKKKQFVLAFEK